MDEDDPLVALRNARSRFIAGFHGQCDSLEALTVAAAPGGAAPERAAARQLVRRVVGLAGTIGFKSLSTRAMELESLLTGADPYDPGHGRELTRALREAFTNHLTSPPDWALDPATPSSPRTILLVEDDPDQRSVVGAYLRAAGHVVQELGAGDRVLDHVRLQGPSLVLLDIEMPGLNGFSVCRLLKADPELSRIPVISLTTRDALDDRMTGLTLGADEFLNKPVDLRELLFAHSAYRRAHSRRVRVADSGRSARLSGVRRRRAGADFGRTGDDCTRPGAGGTAADRRAGGVPLRSAAP